MTRVSPTAPQKLLKVQEFAIYARLSTDTVYNMVRSGELHHVRYGKSIRIPVDALTSI